MYYTHHNQYTSQPRPAAQNHQRSMSKIEQSKSQAQPLASQLVRSNSKQRASVIKQQYLYENNKKTVQGQYSERQEATLIPQNQISFNNNFYKVWAQ